MDITPAPAFMEAVRQVLGIEDLIPDPGVVLPAMRDPVQGPKIRATHERIALSRAGQFADIIVAEMERDGASTDAIATVWKSEFDKYAVVFPPTSPAA
jgi:L-fucose mutarotase/ribose pyranase (RbsD/FucU family)